MGQTKSRLYDEAILIKQEKNTRAFGQVAFCETKISKIPLVACEAKYSKNEPQFYLDLKHPNLASPLVYDAHFKEFLNLNAQGITFYFNYLDVTLDDMITSRKIRNSPFPEQEIINVGLSILSVLLYLKEFDIEGGNIEPSTIFYDKGQIKIYINQLILGRLAAYQMIVNQFQRSPLPSPEILYATKKRELELVEKYRYETDIFTLGLTLLEMATLEKSSELFNIEIRQVNVKKLDQRYAVLKSRYSDRLNNLIRQMLTMDPRQRPICETLINQIRSGVIPGSSAASLPRAVSASRLNPMNRSFLNTSQISGLNSSNLYAQPHPIVVTNNRLASADRRGSFGTLPISTPGGSRIANKLVSQTLPDVKAQETQVDKNDENTNQQQESIKSVPTYSQSNPQINKISQKPQTQKPQIITSNAPQNYLPAGGYPHQYMGSQTVRYVPAPPFSGSAHPKGFLPPSQKFYPGQQQIPQVFHPNLNHPVQITPQSVPHKFVGQQFPFTPSSQNLLQYAQHQPPIRQVINNYPHNIPRGNTGSFIQNQGQLVYQHGYPQSYQQLPQQLQAQPNFQSPQIQRNQVKTQQQNNQTETVTRIQNLGQKVQELDDRVSKSIANSVKVTQQHYKDADAENEEV